PSSCSLPLDRRRHGDLPDHHRAGRRHERFPQTRSGSTGLHPDRRHRPLGAQGGARRPPAREVRRQGRRHDRPDGHPRLPRRGRDVERRAHRRRGLRPHP
ncbi:MAG TPA: hypothetical protein DD664_02485, partial [Janibacter terrae]|nr:hypothetical protein [Janibacter terrae]